MYSKIVFKFNISARSKQPTQNIFSNSTDGGARVIQRIIFRLYSDQDKVVKKSWAELGQL